MNVFYRNMLGIGIVAVVATGCEQAEPEPTADAVDLLSFAIDPFTSGEGVDEFKHAPGRFLWMARQCDESPDLEFGELNGHPVLTSANFDWQECTVDLPEGAPAESLETSGELDIASEPSREGGLNRTATFSINRVIEGGPTMNLVGSAETKNVHPQSEAIEVEFSMRREMVLDGAVGGSGELSGTVSVVLNEDDGSRSVSGELAMAIDNPRFGNREMTMTLENVVRVAHEICVFPVGGSIVREGRDGEEHTLTFGSVCGEGTLDGEPVDLEELSARRGRRGGRP